MNDLVSVVITCYNKEKYILDAMNSALQQEGVHEVVVVDDGSTDGSANLISSIAKSKNLLLSKNVGVSAATRIGIEAAIGGGATYVTLLDGDDVLAPNSLLHYLHVFENTDVDAVYSTGSRDRIRDMREEVVPCGIEDTFKVCTSPLGKVLREQTGSTVLCARPEMIIKHFSDEARIQDYQIVFSVHIEANSVAYSKAITHYCSFAVAGENLSEDVVALLISSTQVYANLAEKMMNHNDFRRYQRRALSSALRLRHHSVYSVGFRSWFYLITPFKKLFTKNFSHKLILAANANVVSQTNSDV